MVYREGGGVCCACHIYVLCSWLDLWLPRPLFSSTTIYHHRGANNMRGEEEEEEENLSTRGVFM